MQRIGLTNTTSYAELPVHWQHHLKWLHDDYFYHRHSKLWTAQAMESLPLLMQATNMLVCGEDLGMVPDCVPPVLQRLGLIGEITKTWRSSSHKLHWPLKTATIRLP